MREHDRLGVAGCSGGEEEEAHGVLVKRRRGIVLDSVLQKLFAVFHKLGKRKDLFVVILGKADDSESSRQPFFCLKKFFANLFIAKDRLAAGKGERVPKSLGVHFSVKGNNGAAAAGHGKI